MSLLRICHRVCQRKNFENRLTFGERIHSLVHSFIIKTTQQTSMHDKDRAVENEHLRMNKNNSNRVWCLVFLTHGVCSVVTCLICVQNAVCIACKSCRHKRSTVLSCIFYFICDTAIFAYCSAVFITPRPITVTVTVTVTGAD